MTEITEFTNLKAKIYSAEYLKSSQTIFEEALKFAIAVTVGPNQCHRRGCWFTTQGNIDQFKSALPELDDDTEIVVYIPKVNEVDII